MKNFLVQTFLALLVSLLATGAFYFLSNYLIEKRARFAVDKTKSLIILGHSHPEMAYNDSLIPSAKNVASAAEAYFYSYHKLKKILPQNSQIKTVLIECTNNQFIASTNDWIWGDKMPFRVPKYNPFLDWEEKSMLFQKNPIPFINANRSSMKANFERIIALNLDYTSDMGGYGSNNHVLTDSVSGDLLVPVDEERSELNMRYLRKMIDYCKKRGVEVYLVRSPTLGEYYKIYPNQDFQDALNTYFNDVPFLDFSGYKLHYSDFIDYEHMNRKGARRYSLWFNNLLASGLLQASNKQAFINKNLPS